MIRTIAFNLCRVAPTPASLRATPFIDAPGSETEINLAQLFQQYYLDSYPAGPPNPDPSNFEYLSLVSASPDFRFHEHVRSASLVKRRAISTELGQAFCRQMLHDHFGIVYFAHMADVLDRPTHAAFDGMRILRITKGSVPDYLCARKVTEPFVAEAKGRFSSIAFDSKEWGGWREQFSRIRVESRAGVSRRIKGFIVATRFISQAAALDRRTTTFLEDPDTEGENAPPEGEQAALAMVAVAMHYSRVFSKLGMPLFASALGYGFSVPGELSFHMPVWKCVAPPFEQKEFIGGLYRTSEGPTSTFTEKGWLPPAELGRGHLAFVGLSAEVARVVATAVRGSWRTLARVEPPLPEGVVTSDFGWLLDGTVCTPAEYFVPTGTLTL